MIQLTPKIAIEDGELQEQFIRASGPGGQNVNKVSTAVELRFDMRGSPNLPGPVKARLQALAGSRMTKDGVLVIRADRFRSQNGNRVDALQRLKALVARAETPPKPRVKTKPSRAEKRRRLETKVKRSILKRVRREPPSEE